MSFEVITSLKNSIGRIDLDTATGRALKARSNDIAELNRDQLKQGKRADGSFLPDYSNNSVTKFGKKKGPIKLYDTGDFYEGIKPEFAKTDFLLKDDDSKTDLLEDRYGDDILGLSKENIEELAQDSLGQIQYEIRNELR